jgi:hypothetical protein
MWKLSNVDWRRPRNQVSHDLLLDDQVMPNILAVAESNSKYKLPGVVPAGFWVGLWHGIIAPLLFWVSLLVPGVRIYETNNKGRRYDFGFLLGVGAWANNEARRAAHLTYN